MSFQVSATGGKRDNFCNSEKKLIVKRFVSTEVLTEPFKRFQLLDLLLEILSIFNKETESQLIAF